jgi:hypothetical protein
MNERFFMLTFSHSGSVNVANQQNCIAFAVITAEEEV